MISVIIPTTAEASRSALLERALHSILTQEGVNARPLVVVNGMHRDQAVVTALRARPDITVVEQPVAPGHVAEAQTAGVRAVERPYYAFLDDDDELLPGALALRRQRLDAQGAALVVTNVWIERDGRRELLSPDFATYAHDPLGALARRAWLCSDNGLYRRAAIPATLFEGRERYLEWTQLAERIARRGLPIAFDPTPTAVYYDTANSASKRQEYFEAEARLLGDFLTRPWPGKARKHVAQKYAATLNHLSRLAHRAGARREAWRYHVRTLSRTSCGWRYLPYTRHLLR